MLSAGRVPLSLASSKFRQIECNYPWACTGARRVTSSWSHETILPNKPGATILPIVPLARELGDQAIFVGSMEACRKQPQAAPGQPLAPGEAVAPLRGNGAGAVEHAGELAGDRRSGVGILAQVGGKKPCVTEGAGASDALQRRLKRMGDVACRGSERDSNPWYQ
jgi:hypothetical protein